MARELEPTRVRSWRHRQMEKALQRRIEAEIRKGKRPAEAMSDADDFLTEFTSQFPAIDAEMLAEAGVASDTTGDEGLFDGIGMDLTGDSYEGDGAEPDPAETEAMNADMLDIILADEALTDELIERLSARYNQKEA